MIFSKRQELSIRVTKWCDSNGVELSPLNVITTLDALGFLKDKQNEPLASNEESNLFGVTDYAVVAVLFAYLTNNKGGKQEDVYGRSYRYVFEKFGFDAMLEDYKHDNSWKVKRFGG